jgi:Ca2+-binding EF-hand superfamily protein
MVRNLPEVAAKDLLLWDDEHRVCGGFLNKKASQTSTFSKGKWQKRWFAINLDVNSSTNYAFEYFHHPDDKLPSKSYNLAGSTIKISGGNSFVIAFNDGTVLSLSAESSDLLRCWASTLESVISVSNMRDRMMEKYESASDSDGGQVHGSDDELGELDGAKPRHKRFGVSDHAKNRTVHVRQKHWPTLRVDQDVASIPPGTNERHRFMASFCADIAHALSIDTEFVEVVSIRPAPGMDWLCLIEFDINLWSADFGDVGDHHSGGGDADAVARQRRLAVRRELLESLQDMVVDPNSTLFHGYVTSKVDPSYSAHVVDRNQHNDDDGQDEDDDGDNDDLVAGQRDDNEIFSSDPNLMKLMTRYKDIYVPESFHDQTFLTITLYFEGRIAKVKIPNPALLTKRHCALWPFEVKSALGFLGTMQELWIEPLELVARDGTNKAQSESIRFSPSVRLGGEKVINAVHLHADGHYDVKCEDQRDEALNSLSKEEMDEIKEIFQQCDLDGDGGISKVEMESIVRTRTQERKVTIEKKFKKYITDNDLSSEEVMAAELNKTRYIQQLQEAQSRLLMMFESADLNGDGIISFTEFILAEAWWMRCTINPSKAHLF